MNTPSLRCPGCGHDHLEELEKRHRLSRRLIDVQYERNSALRDRALYRTLALIAAGLVVFLEILRFIPSFWFVGVAITLGADLLASLWHHRSLKQIPEYDKL